MLFSRNSRISRIMAGVEREIESSNADEPKHTSNDVRTNPPNVNFQVQDTILQNEMFQSCPENVISGSFSTDELTAETCGSSIMMPSEDKCCDSHYIVGRMPIPCLEDIEAPGPSTRERSNSSSSTSSCSSKTSSSSRLSSSSTSTSISGIDFSPDETYRDPDYLLPSLDRPITFSPTSERSEMMKQNVQESNEEENNTNLLNEGVSKRRRRKGLKNLSKKQDSKRLRNSGKQYTSMSKLKKIISQRELGPPCEEKCRLKCSQRIKEEDRRIIFNEYWQMSDLIRQREFISKCISIIKPKYQYKVHDSNRGPKHSFYFSINNNQERVCKVFFKNTLAINNRPIATVIAKKSTSGFIEGEKRGKHGKQFRINSEIIQGIKSHIDSIPRIESHYLRQQTSAEYIDGGKNLTDLYEDYLKECLNTGNEAAKIHTYRKVFKEEFNIRFHVPKKDQCDLCISFKNAVDKNMELTNKYDQHLLEKDLCRQEKYKDKTMVQQNLIVACYDLQAVLPLPKGDISSLYYKCKLNVCNFTISELTKDYCDCFLWSEVEAQRGANEIATCVLKYLTKRASEVDDNSLEVIFYSDNCCGQQKNQFMFTMYAYAISVLKIKSITHKYLISGHTQNENDSVHSVIEKAVKKCLRSGPIYTPDQYITIIRTARKKGNPYKVNEMCFSDFLDIKNLTEVCGGQFSRNTVGETVKLTDIKIISFHKDQDSEKISIHYKTSYADIAFKEIQYYKNRSSRARANNIASFQNFELRPLYHSRLALSERKKKDLKSLIDNNIIPQIYASSFYNNILNQ